MRLACLVAQGETGCGKSSLVPQFIVEDAERRGVPVKMLVTQPRRIAAVTLARRSSSPCHEPQHNWACELDMFCTGT